LSRFGMMRNEKPHAHKPSMGHPQLLTPDEAQDATMPRALSPHCIEGELSLGHRPSVQPDRDVPAWFLPQRLSKVQKFTATARTLTNPFFFDHFLTVDSTPFDANLFKGSTKSQNILSSVFYRVEAVNILWWPDNQKDVVLPRDPRPPIPSPDLSCYA
jgi:hypothetical protein